MRFFVLRREVPDNRIISESGGGRFTKEFLCGANEARNRIQVKEKDVIQVKEKDVTMCRKRYFRVFTAVGNLGFTRVVAV